MVGVMFESTNTFIVLWIIFILSFATEELSSSDGKSIFITTSIDVLRTNDAHSSVIHEFSETSTTDGIYANLDVEILPALTEYTVTPKSTEKDRTFTCKGNEPVQWYFKEYDDHVWKKKSLSVEVFSKYRNSSTYLSFLSLNEATYMDTGRYYCAPLVVDTKLIEMFVNSSIYISVRDEFHLIACPENFDLWNPKEGDNYSMYIPCRPTSPNVDIHLLTLYGNEIFLKIQKERFVGFLFGERGISNTLYRFIAKGYNRTEERIIIISPMITIRDEYSINTTVGRNLTLKCSVHLKAFAKYLMLEWLIPKGLIDQPERVQYDDFKIFKFNEFGDIQLEIPNVTFEHNGEITCRLFYSDKMDNIFIHDETYKLQMIPPNENCLKINFLYDNNLIIRPVGYHRVKWTVKVPSNPNAILEWRGPDDNKLQTNFEKIFVNTNNGSTELIIKNLQVSDSGVYKLSANNSCNKDEINVTLIVEDLKIFPDLTEYILPINSAHDDRTLTCKGNEPVQWYFEEYNGDLIKKKSSLMKTFSKKSDNHTYLSLLSLKKATYMDTGYYYCTPMPVESKSIRHYKNIYIFIHDETHLFAIPDDFNEIQTPISKLIIPCRPTSPEINVQLFTGKLEVTNMFHYNNKIGFVSFGISDFKNYSCVAKKNSISEHQRFGLKHKVLVRIYNEYSDYVISGQNLTLKCDINDKKFSYYLDWDIPDNIKNQSKRITYVNVKKLNSELSYIQLNIKNVSIEDEGYYICIMKWRNITSRAMYKLKVNTLNETHLSLRIDDNRRIITRPVGYHSAQWKIKVIAHPAAVLKWMDPRGISLKTNSGKIFVKNYNHSSYLIIKDIELKDSGTYTLVANNEAEEKEINVTLFVEVKPSVVCTNSSSSEDLYCETGKCSFEFLVSGYPLPEVVWSFKNCTNDSTECEHPYEQTQYIKTEETSLVGVKMLITLNITQSSTLICKASNALGILTMHFKIWFSDEYKGFEIKGPSIIIAGDNVTLVCGVSRYNYDSEILWNYPNENQNKPNVKITINKTDFSYLSYLAIENISIYFNGNISCSANKITKSIEELPDTRTFTIQVEDSYEPVLKTLSNKITWKMKGEDVEMLCIAIGMPPPSIQWFKDNKPLHLDESRMQIENQNQTLIINSTKSEDEGIYICNATNRVGSAILTFYLNEDTRFGDILLCCLLTTLLVIIVNAGVLWYITERKVKKKLLVYNTKNFEKGTIENWNPLLGVQEQAHILPYDIRWEFPRGKLELGEQIGSGAFGVVYKAKATGILNDHTVTTVAVKTVRPTTDPSHRIALATELKIMTQLGRHLNVVNVLGACTSSSISNKLMVIVEYCCYGSIDRYMQKHKNEFINLITPDGFIDQNIEIVPTFHCYENVPLKTSNSETNNVSGTQIASDRDLVSNQIGPKSHIGLQEELKNTAGKPLNTNDLLFWSFQISRGMEFLASRKIFHGDLATRNILLAEGNVVKICDFGLAKNLYTNEIYKKSKKALLPIKWLAIESMSEGIFSTASDVWSFGVVLWEIFSLAAVPYPNIQVRDLLDRLVQGYRMEQSNYSNSEIYNIMLDCWEMEPKKRPSFTNLVERLGELLGECTKSHFVQLENRRMKVYDERLPSTNVLSVLAEHKSSKCSLVVPDGHTETSQQISERFINTDDIELNPIVHNACYSNQI